VLQFFKTYGTTYADLAEVQANLGALDFLLANRPGTALEKLSVAKAFEISKLAETYGPDSVLMVLNDLGTDPSAAALLRDTPQASLDLYLKGYTSPGSVLPEVSVQDGIHILEGLVVEIDRTLAPDLAAQLADLSGRNAWASRNSGRIYLSTTTPRAIAALEQLVAEGPSSPNRASLIRIIAEESIRGSGDHLVLGPYRLSSGGVPVTVDGVTDGLYIQKALNNNGLIYDLGSNQFTIGRETGNMWTLLKRYGVDPIEVNEAALQILTDSKIPRIEFTVENAFDVIADPATMYTSRAAEIRWLLKYAEDYEFRNNSWTLVP
jgi:hypothetical protein